MEASLRYGALMRQALLDVEADHERPGSKERPEIMIEGARTDHLALSRTRVTGPRVKDPRHSILYLRRQNGVVEVARILHDSRELMRHLPEESHRS